MARASYGPEAKKRSLLLFTVLLDYASDELDCDEAALNALRAQIQTHWQTERRLVVRTKVRFLEALTKLAKVPLSAEQIKEALRRFEDFLGILDDNRPCKSGSETWHFTLNLWHSRNDRAANLRQFEQTWEQRRPQKSKQVTQAQTELTSEIIEEQPANSLPVSEAIANSPLQVKDHFWRQLCRESLEAQQYQRLTINPLTVTNGVTFDLHELYLPLELIERKQQEKQNTDIALSKESLYRDAEEFDADSTLSFPEFCDHLQTPGLRRVAIVGEPGAGKTTLLQKIATWLLEQQALPIWVSLADLQGATLEHYLLHDWLKQATRKISVTSELQEALAEQVRQGQVWLLLDAIDEMAIDAAVALSSLARQLRGWIADAHIVLTCRSHVWDNGKNALDAFTVYCNLSFSNGSAANGDQVGQFIDRWFQDRPQLGYCLRQELHKPERRRVRHAVKNPLRLALLCRSWSLAQGTLPQTKALLYQQFVETIYEWKQDRFPTTPAQRQQLNQALGQVARSALTQAEAWFRLSHSFVQRALGDAIELMPLALQLGWLSQVGTAATTGEKVYAFYHPTFQEYFAAQAISDWRFFLEPADDCSGNLAVFSSHWREVLLLWLGRSDMPIADKEAFIQALITFKDNCGGFYSHQAYLLAAAGLAEFPQCRNAATILTQVLAWRFEAAPVPLCEGARVALLQSDRTLAIAALEQFIQSTANPFACWSAAYTLGKTFDAGNATAIAALSNLIDTLHNEALRLQLSESLSRIDPGNPISIRTLEAILDSTQQETLRRRAAYSLGKLVPDHAKAMVTLEQIMRSTPNPTLRRQTAENLLTLNPDHAAALAEVAAPAKAPRTSQRHRTQSERTQDISQVLVTLEQRLAIAKNASNQRRLAHRLATLQPGHPQAIDRLLQLLLSQQSAPLHKRVVEDLKEVLLDEQLPTVVARLSTVTTGLSTPLPVDSAQQHECYKLLWFCAQRLPYADFARAFSGQPYWVVP